MHTYIHTYILVDCLATGIQLSPCLYVSYITCDSYCLVSLLPKDGWTALRWAIVMDHPEIVKELLSGRAQVDLLDEVRHNINW